MHGFCQKDKMSKRQQERINKSKRIAWECNPVTRIKQSDKLYDRKHDKRNVRKEEW